MDITGKGILISMMSSQIFDCFCDPEFSGLMKRKNSFRNNAPNLLMFHGHEEHNSTLAFKSIYLQQQNHHLQRKKKKKIQPG